MSAALHLWLGIFAVSLTGVLTRCSFLVFGERLRLPPAVERALSHAPAAALAAIVVPALVTAHGELALTLDNHRLVAGLVAALVMWRTRGMLWTMAAGMTALTILRLYT